MTIHQVRYISPIHFPSSATTSVEQIPLPDLFEGLKLGLPLPDRILRRRPVFQLEPEAIRAAENIEGELLHLVFVGRRLPFEPSVAQLAIQAHQDQPGQKGFEPGSVGDVDLDSPTRSPAHL